ncbi:MAG: type II secretion system F family protein [Candidatus Pacebacteria bacterium]|nr:type II secretion system F family protein [Candidatus Paceibacterota bacterium]
MKFKYKAISISGVEQVGKIEAGSRKRAIELLQKHKLVIISIEEIKELISFKFLSSFFHRVSNKKIVIFSKELSILLMAGVSLAESLKIQYDQEENPYFKEQIFKISNMVEDGVPFSTALSKFPNIFSDFFVNIVKSGEASGKMQESLLHLSDYIEKQYLLTSKVKSALMYPAIILGGFALVGIGMMAFVVPQLIGIFEGSDQELPLPTKILIFVSDFMQHNIILIAIGLCVLGYIIKKYVQTSKGRSRIDVLVLKIPQFSPIFKKFYVARFAENLSMLISSGIPIINALQISGDVVGNSVYRKIIYNSVDEVKIGGSIAYSFERSDQLPVLVPKMIRVGEKTGKLDLVLNDIAKFYTKEVDIAIDGLTAIIEPIMIFVLGGAVAILVASILMPIYQMTTMI